MTHRAIIATALMLLMPGFAYADERLMLACEGTSVFDSTLPGTQRDVSRAQESPHCRHGDKPGSCRQETQHCKAQRDLGKQERSVRGIFKAWVKAQLWAGSIGVTVLS